MWNKVFKWNKAGWFPDIRSVLAIGVSTCPNLAHVQVRLYPLYWNAGGAMAGTRP